MDYQALNDWIHFATQKSISEEDTHTDHDEIICHVVNHLSGGHMVGTLGSLQGPSMASHHVVMQNTGLSSVDHLDEHAIPHPIFRW